MATKLELEAELEKLKTEMAALAANAEAAQADASTASAYDLSQVRDKVQQVLSEHGIDAGTMDSLGKQMLDEFISLQKDKPLIVLIGVFGLGCLVGRAFR